MSSRVKGFQRTNLYRVQRFVARFKEYDMKSNISMNHIETMIRRLRMVSS
jgi:hypothetical protein